ncbi:hypothetical protein Ancab_007480 [Ancistrocladus abbreviatus]
MMATFYHGGSEIQADNLQTLYLMNPNYAGYSVSDTHQQQPSSMILLNPAAAAAGSNNALNPGNITHAPPPPLQSQHFLGIPLSNPDDPSRPSLHEIPALHGLVPRVHYNLWSSLDPSAAAAPAGGQPHIPTAVAVNGGAGGGPELMAFRRPQQGLSLSLSPQQNSVSLQQQGPGTVLSPTSGGGGDDLRMSGGSPTSASAASNGVSGVQSVILGSKYLKAAQQLLDEVVSVGKAIKTESGAEVSKKEKNKAVREPTGEGSSGGSAGGGESGSKRGVELTTAQRQELQMKKAKLLNMLDEVEQRYRQYHHQMQIVVTTFEQAAGLGSAKSYTSLALKTISKQFRCLKDAITAQIKATSKSLGEEDAIGSKGEGSRLRFVDNQLRQQRALQQLGMMQHNAWRPQRGLPERAVSVLRAWLFEHFLHPYPKDSDKHMLAKQTGLTRSQVSNWFINARVRLWKPMVEEMYLEEIKAQERNGSEDTSGKIDDYNSNNNGSKDLTSSSKPVVPHDGGMIRIEQAKTPHLPHQQDKSPNKNPSINDLSNVSTMSSTPATGVTLHPTQGFSLISSPDMESMVQRSPTKKHRSNHVNDMQNSPSSILSMEMEMKPGGETGRELEPKYGPERHPLMNHGFAAYQMGDMARFNPEQLTQRYHGNGVSLTLGLPHCENLSLSGTHHQQSYISSQNIQLGRRLEMGTGEADFCGISNAQPSHSGAGYESIDLQNRKRFAAQLLPDFVA